MFIGGWALSGGKKKDAQQVPPINASSKDEENFIQYVHARGYLPGALCDGEGERGVANKNDREFLKNAEAENKDAKKH
jgi:hypothetical protein